MAAGVTPCLFDVSDLVAPLVESESKKSRVGRCRIRLMADKRFQAAFGATFCALMLTIAGLAGFAINWHGLNARFGRQTGAPVLWEIGLGAVFAVAAIITWRRALRSL